MTNHQIIIFVFGTICVICFSWMVSLRQKRYHAIARFFSFESIVLMVILNFKYWFVNPFSPNQILSWLFLAGCVPIAVVGFVALNHYGKPKGIIEFENTSKLVATGLYGYIRHPLYCSLMVLGMGVFLKKVELAQIILFIVNTIALYLTCIIEEKEMIHKFGDEYLEYMKKTKMFIPFVL